MAELFLTISITKSSCFLGLTTSSTFEAELDVDVEIEGDSPPDARLDVTGTISDVEVLTLDITGTATDDFGVADLRFEFRDADTGLYLQADGSAAGARTRLPVTSIDDSDPTAVTYLISVELPMAGDWRLEVYAYDTSGQIDTSQSGATARYLLFPGDEAPIVSLLSPPAGTVFDDARLIVTGRVEDDIQIARAEVAIQNSDGLYMNGSGNFTSGSPSWQRAFLTSPGSPGSNFSYTSPPIPDGDYTIYARGTDQRGAVTEEPRSTTATVTSPPNDPPVADFTYNCDDNECTFDGRISTDEDPGTLSYSWNFGNGGGSGPLPTRTYTSAGDYTVVLTVTDYYGVSSIPVEQVITIGVPPDNQAPVPVIAAASCNLVTCNFSSAGTEDPDDGDSYSLLWEFGDEETSSSSYPSHTYDEPGIYTVRLTVTDGWGATQFVEIVVDVSVPAGNVAPTPVIETPVCTGLSCDFSSVNTFDSNAGDTYAIAWDFGDTGTSTTASPTYLFAESGDYTVTLTATDVWGASASVSVGISVSDI